SLKQILVGLGEGEDVYEAIANYAGPMDKIEKGFAEYATDLAEGLAVGLGWQTPEDDGVDMRDRAAVAAWVEQHPNTEFGLNFYAMEAMRRQRWEDAKAPLERLIELHPDQVEPDNAYVALARVHRELGEFEEERAVLERLSLIAADALDAYGRLIELAAKDDDWRGVVEHGEKYLAVNPMLSRLHGDLGAAYESLGDVDEAAESYKRLIALGPLDPAEAHYRLARLLAGRDDAGARRHVLESLAEAPRYREAHRLLLEISRREKSGGEGGADRAVGVGEQEAVGP
ncbi:MAG: tetratricopeptide repeat protein, partial [Planctomycetota bacterium]